MSEPPVVPGAQRSRLVGVDATRGLALLGMMAVHVLPGTDPDGSASTSALVAGGRSAATFAVLAGVGLALSTGRTRPYAGRSRQGAAAAIAVRAVCIGAIGLLLGELDSGVAVILPYYAVLFLLALPLLGAGPRLLLPLGLGLAVVVPVVSHVVRGDLAEPFRDNPTLDDLADPTVLVEVLLLTGYYPALAWTAYLCVGMGVGRLPLQRRGVAVGLLATGATLAVWASLLSELLLERFGGERRLAASADLTTADLDAALDRSLFGTTPTDTWWWLAVDAPHSTTPLDLLHTIGTAVGLLGGLLLLAHVARGAAAALRPLAAAGGMTLSIYTTHVVLLGADVLPEDPQTSYLLQVVAFVAAAAAWRAVLGRGPLEAMVAVPAGSLRRTLAGPAVPRVADSERG